MSTQNPFEQMAAEAGAITKTEALRRQRELVGIKEQQLKLREGLPFLFGWKWYTWAREFYESTNKLNLLCAANQISKSSTQIRKCINWATNTKLWPTLWANQPTQFWYLYPTGKQAKIEFETKWKLFLPKGDFKQDPVFGWREEFVNKELFAIHFNSGVHVYFKTYAQDTQSLQTGTCDAIFCDEELPLEHYDELIFRLSASDGYFHMVFTATLGQDFWRQVMEPGDKEEEKLPQAFKQIVSMYDCMRYEDGDASHWTAAKIQMVINRCQTHNEVLKRVYGRFVVGGGRKYEAFDIKRHIKESHPLPKDWLIYAGVDIGSGGKEGHPSAIVFVAVKPDFSAGRVFLGWRGDGQATTAGDVVEKFIDMKKEHKVPPLTSQFYDWGCRDFFEISARMGEPFIAADKNHTKGEQVLNVLFKNDMLFLYDTPDVQRLAAELSSLRAETPKNKAKDDFADALRYAVTKIPWDWSVITGDKPADEAKPEEKLSEMQRQIQERRKHFEEGHRREEDRIEDEIAEWNALGGN
jgi:hypothetical protein